MTNTWRKRAAGLGTALAVAVAAGCTKSDEVAYSSGGPGIPVGSSKAEYRAAFEDVEPINLTFQVASPSPESYASKRDVAYAKSLEEWSGGKISIDIHYAGAITSPTETPDALVDGRLDMAHYYTTYEPNEMAGYVAAGTSMVQVPSTPLVGEIVLHAVYQDIVFQNSQIVDEFTDRGMYPLVPASSFGVTELSCASPRQSLSEFTNAQIRGNARAHETQIAALGGTISSIELAEGYEAFQRGVLDCSLQAPGTAVSTGWLDVAPNVYFPRKQGFAAGAGSLVVGATWEKLPLVAQQLMVDRLDGYMADELAGSVQSIHDTVGLTKDNGGGVEYLDPESEEALGEANEKVLEQVEESKAVDGKELNADTAASIEKWTKTAHDLGYTEGGDVGHFDSWYKGAGDSEYLQPFAEEIYSELLLPRRPS